MSEEWREVPGFPGYAVSDLGRVRGKRAPLLKPGKAGQQKYLMVHLTNRLKNRKGDPIAQMDGCLPIRHAYVHHLVAEAFIGPKPFEGAEVAHLNGNNQDNRATNLAWVTRTENERHKDSHGTRPHGEDVWNCRIPPRLHPYIWADIDAGDVQRRIAERWGVSFQTITNIKKARQAVA